MSAKNWFRWIFVIALAGTLSLLAIWTVPAQAQCGDNPQPSACITCHAEQLPVYENGQWHIVHARKECCVNCHGGNCSATEKEQAHVGLVANPLSDIYLSCHQCHPDYVERAAQFATILQITPASSATSTPVPVIPVTGGSGPGEIVIPPVIGQGSTSQPPFGFFAAGLVILAFFLLGLGWLSQHKSAS